MKRPALAIVSWTVTCVLVTSATADGRWTDFVDPFIGTGGHGHTYPGASMPFGMVQLSPDTRLSGWDGCSGYHDDDRVIYGFSHTHLSGTGVPDYCDVLLMPITGASRWDRGTTDDPDGGYASRFDKDAERAGPGWYSVELADGPIGVDLTVTPRVGLHRYRFPAGVAAHVVIDLTHRDELLDWSLRVVNDREIEGTRRSRAWATDQRVHFLARFSRPFTESLLGDFNRKAMLSFGEDGGELLVKVAISAVDVAGARRNLEAELPGWDFEATRQAASDVWNDALGRIEVRGGTDEQKTIFYTALYHSLLAPNLFSDVDGRYLGLDKNIHVTRGRAQYTVFSLWDTFRATHPLFTLLEPDRTVEFIETFLAQFDQSGRLPVWELAANETNCMIGYHAVSVIADAYLKGIDGFDAERALEAMVTTATVDRFGLDVYRRQGFLGADDEPESVSKTLEYAYDDWCIAQMAKALGHAEVEKTFRARSQGWRHLLDPQTLFMRARRNQRWVEPFDPRQVDLNYTEANAWQYSFFVPHDVSGLMEALGGEDAFVARLDALFEAQSRTTGRDQADITGLIGQYAHGNEPSHHMAWLYHYAGRPQKSAAKVRQILDTLYAAAPDGLAGNEDCGQMSSWYVFGAMGLYPVCPGSDQYVVGAPLFPEIDLHLPGGGEVRIRAPLTGPDALYVTSARWNGASVRRSFVTHEKLLAGGELALQVSSTPQSAWGHDPENCPTSSNGPSSVLPAPYAVADADVFEGQLEVELASARPNASLQYAADGGDWQPYEATLVLDESTRLRFRAEQGDLRSPVVESTFHRAPHDWTVELAHDPSPQYTGGGPQALVDGLRGPLDWRKGGWHGFQYVDFRAVVDLQHVRRLRRAGAGFLQDVKSWIWMPSEVVLSVSKDGQNYHPVATLKPQTPDDATEVTREDLTASLDGVEARYLEVLARSYGDIPAWHPGHGDQAWIFVDEILVE
jgi:predicted alpha-1,2-mannosidase